MTTKKANFLGNYSITAFNMVMPVIILPFLTNSYTKEEFALFSITQALIGYGITIADFAFSSQGTTFIAQGRESVEYYVGSIYVKLLAASVFLMLYVVLGLLNLFPLDLFTLIAVIFSSLSIVISPLWYLNGKQLVGQYFMSYIATRLTCMFIFLYAISRSIEFEYALLLYSLTFLVPSLVLFFIFSSGNSIKYALKTTKMKEHLSHLWPIAASSVVSLLLNGSLIVAAGFIMSRAAVAELSMADKISRIGLGLLVPFISSMIPLIARSFSEKYSTGLAVLKKYALITLVVYSFFSLAIILFSKDIYGLVGKNYYNLNYLIILIAWGFFSILNNFIGIQYMMNTGLGKLYSKIIFFAAVCQMLGFIVYSRLFGPIGIPLGVMITELLLSTIFGVIIYEKRKTP